MAASSKAQSLLRFTTLTLYSNLCSYTTLSSTLTEVPVIPRSPSASPLMFSYQSSRPSIPCYLFPCLCVCLLFSACPCVPLYSSSHIVPFFLPLSSLWLMCSMITQNVHLTLPAAHEAAITKSIQSTHRPQRWCRWWWFGVGRRGRRCLLWPPCVCVSVFFCDVVILQPDS